MRASSWASTTTRRARSVNRSNMRLAPENFGAAPPGSTERDMRTNPTNSLRVPGSGRSTLCSERTRPPSRPADPGGAGDLSEPSVGRVEGGADLGGDATAVGDLEAVGAGPVTDLAGTRALAGGCGGPTAVAAGRRADLAGVAHEGRQRVAQLRGVLLVEVDFVRRPVQPERHGLRRLGPVEIVHQD